LTEQRLNDQAAPSVELLTGRIGEATDRLLTTAGRLSDPQVREPSVLPGWTRGHVLTHVARNADGLRNLLIWAKTGVPTPQYPSREARNAQIEAGSGRPAGEIAADIDASTRRFLDQAGELDGEAWQVEVTGLRGPAHPAWFTLSRRLFEVEVHHADLAAGYRTADWPDWFVAEQLYRVTGNLDGDPATPAAVLTDADAGRQYILRPDLLGPGLEERAISGPGHLLLAWLLGRDDGAYLSADPPGPLPPIPAYG
jgi:maleylpyruvate isomerase